MISSVTKQPTQHQFSGFRRAQGTGYIGLPAPTWVPMGAQVPVLSPYDHPNPSQGQRKVLMKNRIAKNFHVPLNSLSSAKTGQVLIGKGPYGGGRLGVPRVGTREPRHGLGGPYTRKKFFRTRVQIHTQRPQYAKKPPPPPKGVPRCGGGGGDGGQNQKKSLGDHFWS